MPTDHELAIVAAVIRGGEKGAAFELGISPHTVRNMLSAARKHARVDTTIQLVAALDDAAPGWRPRFRDAGVR